MQSKNSYVLSAFAGISLAGALAGCSSTASPTSSGSDGTAASSSPSATVSTDATSSPGASSGAYKDGDYSADGSYQSPAGVGRITVDITLANGVVTAVKVDGHATDPTARSYQQDFEAGISGTVVGKKIDALNVTNVSGSSLTSGGFDQAIKKIEAQARA